MTMKSPAPRLVAMDNHKPVNPADSGQPATSGVSGRKDGDAARHTPGPWTAWMKDRQEWRIDTGPEPTLRYGRWKSMAVVYGADMDADKGALVCEANARLIALSPSLLAALRDLVARCDGDEGVRADGSNIQTMAAHAVLDAVDGL